MTTHEMIRCKKCSCLIEDEDGKLVCGECGEEIHLVRDEDCPCEQEW